MDATLCNTHVVLYLTTTLATCQERLRNSFRPEEHDGFAPSDVEFAPLQPLSCAELFMKQAVSVAITGAAGQIGYALAFRVASGQMLGADTPIKLHLLEVTPALAALQGVLMELADCAFPTLAGLLASDDPKVAFRDCEVALLVGARPRGPGMERKDLLLANAQIFSSQGRALNEAAD